MSLKIKAKYLYLPKVSDIYQISTGQMPVRKTVHCALYTLAPSPSQKGTTVVCIHAARHIRGTQDLDVCF